MRKIDNYITEKLHLNKDTKYEKNLPKIIEKIDPQDANDPAIMNEIKKVIDRIPDSDCLSIYTNKELSTICKFGFDYDNALKYNVVSDDSKIDRIIKYYKSLHPKSKSDAHYKVIYELNHRICIIEYKRGDTPAGLGIFHYDSKDNARGIFCLNDDDDRL